MKFLLWIFDLQKRHQVEIRTYKKGWSGRIFSLILILVLAGAMLGSFYLFLKTINGSSPELLSIIGTFLLMLLCVMMLLDYSILFAIVGFKMVIVGTVDHKASEVSGQDYNDDQGVKSYRWFDLFMGIFSIIVLVLGAIGAYLILTSWNQF